MTRARFGRSGNVHLIRYWHGHSSISNICMLPIAVARLDRPWLREEIAAGDAALDPRYLPAPATILLTPGGAIVKMISFPAAPHDDQVDAFCQALSYLRGSNFDSASFQRMALAHETMVAAQRRGDASGSYTGGMIMNARVQEDIEDGGGGAMVNGVQYTNAARISRRSGW